MNGLRIGFAMCGSYCTFESALMAMKDIKAEGAELVPIMSFNAATVDTRFGAAQDFLRRIEDICGREVITTIAGAEPIGPKHMCDAMVVAPCTGNTLAKLAAGITDTSVTMAVKSHLRNDRPVVLAVASNDALSAGARNIGDLLNRKNYYFVPLSQDDPVEKPRSVVFSHELVLPALKAALERKQLEPIITLA